MAIQSVEVDFNGSTDTGTATYSDPGAGFSIMGPSVVETDGNPGPFAWVDGAPGSTSCTVKISDATAVCKVYLTIIPT